jgi:hypothetical protein
MRGWIAAAVGLFGLVAYVRRRRRPAPPEVEPADELRAKLAEARAGADVEPVADPEPEPAADAVDERRRDVHEQARAALDELG